MPHSSSTGLTAAFTDSVEEIEALAGPSRPSDATGGEIDALFGALPETVVVARPPSGPLAETRGSRLRAIKFRAGARAERHLRAAAVERSRVGRPRKTRSEMSRSRWRSDRGRDEEIFRFINACLRSGQPLRLTSYTAHTVKAAAELLAEAKLAGGRAIPNVGLPHWDHADPHLKMIGWGLASHEMGATPFTLRLSDAVIDRARADRRGAGRHLQDRLARHLRERLPGRATPFWFAIEAGPMEQPHVHGAIAFAAHDQPSAMAALRAAGGVWRSRARQLKCEVRREPIGWIAYSTKWLYGSQLRLRNENVTAATNAMRNAARQRYLDARKHGHILYP